MILGIDPGERRVGVAVADPETRFARPLEVIDSKTTDVVARVAAIVGEQGVEAIVVGKPTALSGREGPAIAAQRRFLSRLRASVDVPITEFDERLTTVVAERQLRSTGAPQEVRRRLRDALAAQVMLQGYLDSRS